MRLTTIAMRIAGLRDDIAARITPDILAQYGVIGPMSVGPAGWLPANTNAPVYLNKDGDVVTFLNDLEGYETARHQMQAKSDSLPAVRKAEPVPSLDGVFAVVMERLRTLTKDEVKQYSPIPHDYWVYPDDYGIEDDASSFDADDVDNALSLWKTNPDHLMFAVLSPLQRASIDLAVRAEKAGFWQQDPKADNVAWGRDGKLKFIDFGSISIL